MCLDFVVDAALFEFFSLLEGRTALVLCRDNRGADRFGRRGASRCSTQDHSTPPSVRARVRIDLCSCIGFRADLLTAFESFPRPLMSAIGKLAAVRRARTSSS